MDGVTLARFEITAKLGEGGMGEVYRAVDGKLGREVALKVLPEALASDPDRLARFAREARMLASLSHPNIASIHEVGAAEWPERAAGKVHFLVMELASGETLADRVKRGPISIREALPIVIQIAEALAVAHAKGIVHRDLKPANIMVDDQGVVKILDFGLAKAIRPEPTSGDFSEAATLTDDVTRQGLVVGTASYMSPEQARGLAVDAQTDIWALGCVLFEMLCGRKAYPGGTATDAMAAVLEREPDWTLLPPKTPVALERLLRRCLAKDRDNRLHHAGDVALELREIETPSLEDEAARAKPFAKRRMAVWAAVLGTFGVGLLLAGWAVLRSVRPSPSPPIRLSVATPALNLGNHPAASMVALSPDGRTLAYVVGSDTDDATEGQLYLRRLDAFEARPVSGAESVYAPFFSPDGQWIGFYSDGAIRKASVASGRPQIICTAEPPIHGATWGPDGSIVFASSGGLFRVSADGGEAKLLLARAEANEFFLLYPSFLPDGKRIVFTSGGPDGQALSVDLLDLESAERRRLLDGGGNAVIRGGRELFVAREGALWSAPFDPASGRLSGTLEMQSDDLLMGFGQEPALGHFAVSATGIVAYVPGPMLEQGGRLTKVSRDGEGEPVGSIEPRLLGPRWSPDGRQVAVSAKVGEQPQGVRILDIARGTFTPVPFQGLQAWWPLWTPDGARVVFTGVDEHGDEAALYWGPVDGSEPPSRLIGETGFVYNALAWSPDGSALLAHRSDMATGMLWDLMTVRVKDGVVPKPFLATPAIEYQGTLSPDGRWLAYVSDASGRSEVYLRAFSQQGGRWQVSAEGGVEPAWAPDGNEIFYRRGRALMSVAVNTEPVVRLARPERLFEGDYVLGPQYGRNYDVNPDGSGFVMIELRDEEYDPASIRLMIPGTESAGT